MFEAISLRAGLLFLLLLGATCEGLAQGGSQILQASDEVRINPYSKRAAVTAPFDKPFILILPIDSSLTMDGMRQLQLWQENKSGAIARHILIYNATDIARFGYIDTSQFKGYKNLHVFINRQIAPNVRFQIILFHGINNSVFGKLDEINYLLVAGQDNQANIKYLSLASAQYTNGGPNSPAWMPFYSTDVNPVYQAGQFPYWNYFDTALRRHYEALVNLSNLSSGLLHTLGQTLSEVGVQPASILSCNCANELRGNEAANRPTDISLPLYNLIHLSGSQRILIAGGQYSLNDSLFTTPLDISDLGTRKTNLIRTQNALKLLGIFIKATSYSLTLTQASRDNILVQITVLVNRINLQIRILNDESAYIKKALFGKSGLFAIDAVFSGASPQGQDVKTLSGNYVIADIGLANIGSIIDHRFQYYIRPYLGVNISFRAINKTLSFADIHPKTPWHYLSLVLGLTLSPLNREGTMDLYKSMSLMTGIGIRMNKFFRITPGILLYQSINSNPVKQDRYVVAPTLSLSLDLDVASWFSTLSGKL